jgi:hypothetical protein
MNRRLAEVEASCCDAGRRTASNPPSTDPAVLDLLDNPQRRIPAVHVTGTNGKTTTAHIADALLSSTGRRVGRCTSPHLTSIRERIVVDGAPIAPGRFVEVYDDVVPAAPDSPGRDRARAQREPHRPRRDRRPDRREGSRGGGGVDHLPRGGPARSQGRVRAAGDHVGDRQKGPPRPDPRAQALVPRPELRTISPGPAVSRFARPPRSDAVGGTGRRRGSAIPVRPACEPSGLPRSISFNTPSAGGAIS